MLLVNEMDGTEDSSYLTLLHDGTHNYLLQSSEETLGVQDPSLSVEPMFTEIEDANGGWSIGLPILMNGNLIPDVDDNELGSSMNLPGEVPETAVENNIDLSSSLEALYSETIKDSGDSLQVENITDQNQITYPVEYNAEKSFITTDHIFITNDLLLQLNLRNGAAENEDLNITQKEAEDDESQSFSHAVEQEDALTKEHLISLNEEALSHAEVSNYEPEESTQEAIVDQELFTNGSDIVTNGCIESEENFNTTNIIDTADDIIQILNTDGTIININKSLLNIPLVKDQDNNEIINSTEDNFDECFETVTAYKCKKCFFLCEQLEDVMKHWKDEHQHTPTEMETVVEDNAENEILTSQSMPEEELQNGPKGLLELLQKDDAVESSNKPESWTQLILPPQLQKQLPKRVNTVVEHWQSALPTRKHEKMANEDSPSSLLASKVIEETQKNEVVKNASGHEVKLKSILKTLAQKMVYLCSECQLGYASMEKLRHHMITVHRLVQKPTELETKNIDNKLSNENKNSGKNPNLTIALIQRQARASKKIKCSVKGCELRFAMDEMRIRHERCHVEGQKKQFKCFECNSKFSLWRICSMHMWKCHKVDLGLYTCPMCSVVKVSTPLRLMNHMAIHEGEKPFLCNVCGKSFKQHAQLRNHQVIHKDSHDIPEWAVHQQCEICKKYFSNSKSLKKHIQSVHDKFKPFICNICGHKSGRKSMLDLHLRQHTGEKPHKCPICEFRTGDHNSLRRHIMRHSGNTKYSCPHCDYQSIQSTSYKNHIASKHPGLGGSFFCSLCSYHTVNENTYLSHIADHKNGLIKEVNSNYKDSENDEIYNNLATITGENPNGIINNTIRGQQLGDIEDDETQTYLTSMMDHSNDAVDTGGITIPAGLELQVPL